LIGRVLKECDLKSVRKARKQVQILVEQVLSLSAKSLACPFLHKPNSPPQRLRRIDAQAFRFTDYASEFTIVYNNTGTTATVRLRHERHGAQH
jgi:hypothetical protein